MFATLNVQLVSQSLNRAGEEQRQKVCRCLQPSTHKLKVEGLHSEVSSLSQTSLAVTLPPSVYSRRRKDENNLSEKTGI